MDKNVIERGCGEDMIALAEKLRILGHPMRMRVLDFLQKSHDAAEFNVNELAEILQLDQSTLSNYLVDLNEAGFVNYRRRVGRKHYYFSDGDAIRATLEATADILGLNS